MLSQEMSVLLQDFLIAPDSSLRTGGSTQARPVWHSGVMPDYISNHSWLWVIPHDATGRDKANTKFRILTNEKFFVKPVERQEHITPYP